MICIFSCMNVYILMISYMHKSRPVLTKSAAYSYYRDVKFLHAIDVHCTVLQCDSVCSIGHFNR
jgi:hypothetical protein